MTSQAWNDDERLLQELAEAVRAVDPLTAALERAGEAAFSWRTIDDELEFASLVYDSVLEEAHPVRGPAAENYRTVLFAGRSVSLQIERNGDVIVGQVVPPGPGQLTVEAANGQTGLVDVDDLGCFCLEEMPTVPIRLRWDSEAAHLVTAWVRL